MRGIILVGVAVLVTVAGCVSSSPPSRFYALTPDVAESEARSVEVTTGIVGVGPIQFPDYLDRPQMVVRSEGNELIVNDFARWGGELDVMFNRAVTENLELLTTTEAVLPFPWPASFDPRFRVVGDVTRFEATREGEVVLDIRWGIYDREAGKASEVQRTLYSESVDASDALAIAAAMSRVTASFSRAAAAALGRVSAAAESAE